jgi:hypothetical protein
VGSELWPWVVHWSENCRITCNSSHPTNVVETWCTVCMGGLVPRKVLLATTSMFLSGLGMLSSIVHRNPALERYVFYMTVPWIQSFFQPVKINPMSLPPCCSSQLLFNQGEDRAWFGFQSHWLMRTDNFINFRKFGIMILKLCSFIIL